MNINLIHDKNKNLFYEIKFRPDVFSQQPTTEYSDVFVSDPKFNERDRTIKKGNIRKRANE